MPPACFAALERGLDAAERAVVGAAERRVERGVGLAVAGRRGSASCGRGSWSMGSRSQATPGISSSRSATSGAVRRAAQPAVVAIPQAGHAGRDRAPASSAPATSSTSVCSPSPPATKSASSSRSVRSGRAATWPPTSSTVCSGVSCLIAVQTWPDGGHDLRRSRRLMAVDHDRGQHRVRGRRRARPPRSAVSSSASASMISTDRPLRRQKVAIRPAQTGFSIAASSLPSDW